MFITSGSKPKKRYIHVAAVLLYILYQSFSLFGTRTNSCYLLFHQVPNCSSPDLGVSPVRPVDAGFYICRVNCGESYEFSQWAQVDVLDVAPSYGERNVVALTYPLTQAVSFHFQNMSFSSSCSVATMELSSSFMRPSSFQTMCQSVGVRWLSG